MTRKVREIISGFYYLPGLSDSGAIMRHMELLTARVCDEYDSPDLAVLVTGFRGESAQLAEAAQTLRMFGHNTITYSFAEDVFLAGDSDLLSQAVNECVEDVRSRLQPELLPKDKTMPFQQGQYDQILPVGVSTGALFALALQRQYGISQGGIVQPGIYGAAGANTAHSIFHNPSLLPLRRAFQQRKVTEQDLTQRWAVLHEVPQDGFVLSLGVFDHIIHYRDMQQRIAAWRSKGTPILQRVLLATHSGTIDWFNHHMADLIHLHDRLREAQAGLDLPHFE